MSESTAFFQGRALRKPLIVLHDLIMSLLALSISYFLSLQTLDGVQKLQLLHFKIAGVFCLLAFGVYWSFGLYKSRWRFASLPDLASLFLAVGSLTLVMAIFSALYSLVFKTTLLPNYAFVVFFVFDLFLLSFSRLSYRYWRFWKDSQQKSEVELPRALVVGSLKDIEAALPVLRSEKNSYLVEGCLSQNSADQGALIHGLSVYGGMGDFDRTYLLLKQRGIEIKHLILLAGAIQSVGVESLIASARSQGVLVSRFDIKAQGRSVFRFTPVKPEDVLLRSTVELNEGLMKAYIRKKRILVTGGGGSIGQILCSKCLDLGAQSLLILENSETNMHRILEKLSEKSPNSKRHFEGRLVDIRDEERMNQIVCDFKPDIVFHAAALKHVPYLETDWAQAIETNVFGTVNTLNAAQKAQAKSFILISTDKAVQPVSVLGYTKRAAEVVVASAAGNNGGLTPLSVRFGNVLGSAGSVMETFAKQIEEGGPVNVTHKDMVRYFMTISEAVDLVIASAAFAESEKNTQKHSLFVLKMGQPVRILDLAERMIRLAGFEPHRDIQIQFTAPRPGEKLFESLFSETENDQDIGLSGVMATKVEKLKSKDLQSYLRQIQKSVVVGNKEAAIAVLKLHA